MGGTYDPKTGQMVWELNVPLEEQLSHYGAHPPSALHGLRCTPIAIPDHRFDGHGEPVNAVFAVACECGCRLFTATGWVDAENDIGPPISLVCDACEREVEIFDEAKHGYDALACGPVQGRVADHPDDFPDPEPPYEVLIRFEFASDVLGGDDWKGREQDVFTWITILVKTPDGSLGTLFDCECA